MLVLLWALLPTVSIAQYSLDTVAEDLSYPWSLAFLPDGEILVTERTGSLRIIRDGELSEAPVSGVPEVYFAGQGGLMDVILDPGFASNRLIYLSYAHGNARANATRIARAVLTDDSLEDLQVLFTVEPAKNSAYHFGGRMTFLPDGTLLVTSGDGDSQREESQNLKSLLGKVIRINRDGSIPDDNPYTDYPDAHPAIWSYGHRNPQAILYDAVSDTVYEHEHGPMGGDELNTIEAAANYGWPAITYGRDYNFASISPYTEYPGMEQPVIYWTPSIAPAGMTMYRGVAFPDWQGNLFVAALAERSIRRLELSDGEVVSQEVMFEDLGERMRDVRTGPDGMIYLVTDGPGGRVLRITPD